VKKPASIGRPHWAVSEREGERAEERATAFRRHGRAGARPGWAELGRLGCISFFFFSGFSNSFSISFL
jgi:hypothetical protein